MRTRPLREVVALAIPWKWEVAVLQGGTPTQIERYVRANGWTGDFTLLESHIGHCWVQDGMPVIVWVHAIADVPTLVHELMHAVFGMFAARGLKHGPDSEEAYTYTVEDLLRRVLRAQRWGRV
jgi:hypothetical protein